MKKYIFLLIAMVSFAISANAQDHLSGHKAKDNWMVSTDASLTTNFHDWDKHRGGVWGIQAAKALTPVVSLEFSEQMGFNNNANWNMDHSVNAVDNVAVFAGTKFNLTNLFLGYNGEPRLFEVQARTSVGYMRSFYPDNGGKHGRSDNNSSVAKLGLDFGFNVGKAKAWVIGLRADAVLKGHKYDTNCDNGVYNEDGTYEGCHKYSHNGVFQTGAYVGYRFKTSNGKHHFTVIDPVTVTNIVEKTVEVPVEKVITNHVHETTYVQTEYMVTFAQNSAELTDQAKSVLDKVSAESVSVVAYASPEGRAEYNKVLSQKRADAVRDYLVNRNIRVTNAEGAGVTGDDSQRVAVITVNE